MPAQFQSSVISHQSSVGKKAESRKLKSESSKKGFTLVELLVAISIIAIISAIGITSYSQAQKLARDSKRKQDLRSIAVALELYHQKNKRYPQTPNFGTQYSDSASTPWIADSPAPPAASIPFDSSYINLLPKDPLKTTTNRYSYFADTLGWGSSACPSGGNFFILYANLENQNDPDLFRKPGNSYKVCGYDPAAIFLSQADKNYFAIVQQQ